MSKAASLLEHKPVIGRTFLSDDDIPTFLRRKVNCSLTAAQVGAFLDKVPDYSDPTKESDWLLEHQPEARVVDAVFAVNLITTLGEAHNGVQTANRRKADLKDAALEAKVHKAARPGPPRTACGRPSSASAPRRLCGCSTLPAKRRSLN